MKKVFALMTLALVGASMTFTSCNKKKDWDCKCATTIGGQVINTTGQINDQTKSDADDACDAIQATYTTNGATSSCSLSER